MLYKAAASFFRCTAISAIVSNKKGTLMNTKSTFRSPAARVTHSSRSDSQSLETRHWLSTEKRIALLKQESTSSTRTL